MSTAPLKKSVMVEVAALRILSVILQLVFLKIYTRYTSTYELGIYYFLFTLSYSLNAFLLIPFDYFQQSRLYTLKQDNISLKSYHGLNIWVLKATLVLFLISEVVCYFIDREMCLTIFLIAPLALSTYAVTFLRGLINNMELRRTAIYTLIAECVLKIGYYFLILHFFKPGAIPILGAVLAASLTVLVVLVILVRRTPEYRLGGIRVFSFKEVFHFSFPISVGAVVNWIQLQGYRMILVPLGLVEMVGIYGTVANVGTSGMNAYSTVFAQLFVPNLYKTHGKYIGTYIRNAVLSIFFVVGCGYFLSKVIIGILTRQEFVKYASLIVFGIISEGGNFLIGALTIYLTIKNRTRVTLKASITGLVIFAISFFMLYRLGLVSVYTIGLPIVLTQIVITLYLMIIVKKVMRHE